jgi:hypothetical protein
LNLNIVKLLKRILKNMYLNNSLNCARKRAARSSASAFLRAKNALAASRSKDEVRALQRGMILADVTSRETSVAMRAMHPLDREAVKDWVDGTKAWASSPALPREPSRASAATARRRALRHQELSGAIMSLDRERVAGLQGVLLGQQAIAALIPTGDRPRRYRFRGTWSK